VVRIVKIKGAKPPLVH